MTPQEVIDTWGELTGEVWRLVPYAVGQAAEEFARAGFTREDMDIVVRYTRRQIARGESGYNPQSLLWRVVSADRWQKFQERLSMAQEALRRYAASKPKPLEPHTRALPNGDKVTVLAPPDERHDVPRADVAAGLRGLADDILKGGKPQP